MRVDVVGAERQGLDCEAGDPDLRAQSIRREGTASLLLGYSAHQAPPVSQSSLGLLPGFSQLSMKKPRHREIKSCYAHTAMDTRS